MCSFNSPKWWRSGECSYAARGRTAQDAGNPVARITRSQVDRYDPSNIRRNEAKEIVT